MVATEYGVAFLKGRTVRERAQSLIEVAHPGDRSDLVEQAREARIIYKDQIFHSESALFYPSEISYEETFGDATVRFRAIRPSDEEEMRRLFYRFSDEAVYYRYFAPIKTMPHTKMQQYVNVDYRVALSILGLIGSVGSGQIIAEGRFVKHRETMMADVAFVVDEKYKGRGIATYLYKLLVKAAKERGIVGFTADVLSSNKAMLKVFEKGGHTIRACLEQGAYELVIPFDANLEQKKPPICDPTKTRKF
jgi:GNAT superfamily N-acetyltransferase